MCLQFLQMKPTVIRNDSRKEFFTEELCYIAELSNSLDDSELSIARARVEPGVTTRWHRLKASAERYMIISGTGEVEIGDMGPKAVASGDVVLIPAMCRQRIRNTSNEDLIFLALCTPRYKQRDYEGLDGD